MTPKPFTSLIVVAISVAFSILSDESKAGIQEIPLVQGQFNFTGSKVLRSKLMEGTVTSKTAPGGPTTITDAAADFSDLASLLPCAHFTIEFESGAWGTFTTGFTATTVTVNEDISSVICPGDNYIIRQANTLSSLFGWGKTLKLKGGSLATADLVYVPDGSGGWNIFYYDNLLCGWSDAAAVNSSEEPIYIIQGYFIYRRGVTTTIALSGESKQWPTVVDTDLPMVKIGTTHSALSGIYDNSIGVEPSGLMTLTPHPCAPAGVVTTLMDGLTPALADEVLHWGAGTVTVLWKDTTTGLCLDTAYIPCNLPLSCGFLVFHKSPRIKFMLVP